MNASTINTSTTDCYICFANKSVKLKCNCTNAFFCENCAYEWYKKVPFEKFTCPTCREPIHDSFTFSAKYPVEELVQNDDEDIFEDDEDIFEDDEDIQYCTNNQTDYYNDDYDDERTIDYYDYDGPVYEHESDEEGCFDEYNKPIEMFF